MDRVAIELDGGAQLARPAKPARPTVVERWPGIIACCGPEGETAQPNPTDNTYWVQRAEAINTDATVPLELEIVTTVLYLIGEQNPATFDLDELITQATTGAIRNGIVPIAHSLAGIFAGLQEGSKILSAYTKSDRD